MEQIRVIYTSQRGAHLITNGVKVVWIMARCLREDGTITPSGLQALEASDKTYDDWQRQQAEREEDRKRTKEAVSLTFDAANIRDNGEKSWAYKTNDMYYNRYRRLCHSWEYIPKSQITIVESTATYITMSMPRWLADKIRRKMF